MKLLVLTSLALFSLTGIVSAQTQSEEYLEKYRNESSLKTDTLENQITKLKHQIERIDKDILNAKSDKEELVALKERVQILEKIESNNIEKREQILSENYSSAVINLISLEKDIQPIHLYNSATNYYKLLEQVSNPTNYTEYQEWMKEYKSFLNEKSSTDVLLNAALNIVQRSGIVGGPIGSEVILSSIEKFIQFLGTNKKKNRLKAQSAKMFQLIVTLKQFENEKQILDEKFQDLADELSQLENTQKTALNDVIKTSRLTRSLMQDNYFNETNPTEIHNYLDRLKNHIDTKINTFSKKEINHQMHICQSLKIRFGDILENMAKNLKEYDELVNKYQTLNILKLSQLSDKYDQLEHMFHKYYNGEKIKMDALKMYRFE